MARKHISQTEAQRLKRENESLRQIENNRRNAWCLEYPGGVNIATFTDFPANLGAAIRTSRLLKHAVVCVADGSTVRFYALPVAEEEVAHV